MSRSNQGFPLKMMHLKEARAIGCLGDYRRASVGATLKYDVSSGKAEDDEGDSAARAATVAAAARLRCNGTAAHAGGRPVRTSGDPRGDRPSAGSDASDRLRLAEGLATGWS